MGTDKERTTITKILGAFDIRRTEYMDCHGGTWGTDDESKRAEEVSTWAVPVASSILHTGYFLVDGLYRIYPTVLELYYHEESDDGLEDPIMYHTDARCPSYLGEYPYFRPGSFHLHTSGIDITFEKEGEYRASFLIREFRVADASGKTIVENDDKSTHLFDYMFPYGVSEESLSKISWITAQEPHEDLPVKVLHPRKNVCRYKKRDDGRYRTNVTKSGNRYFEKIENEPCGRPWQFTK